MAGTSDWIKRERLMDTTGLTRKARALRAAKGMTQEEVAALILSERTGRPISKQTVSKAESDDVGSEMNGVRVKIIEALSGKSLLGPVWFFEEELPPADV